MKKPFTKKQYEEALNACSRIEVPIGDTILMLINNGSKYRRDFPRFFNDEYAYAITDTDMIYYVTGKYPA